MYSPRNFREMRCFLNQYFNESLIINSLEMLSINLISITLLTFLIFYFNLIFRLSL